MTGSKLTKRKNRGIPCPECESQDNLTNRGKAKKGVKFLCSANINHYEKCFTTFTYPYVPSRLNTEKKHLLAKSLQLYLEGLELEEISTIFEKEQIVIEALVGPYLDILKPAKLKGKLKKYKAESVEFPESKTRYLSGLIIEGMFISKD